MNIVDFFQQAQEVANLFQDDISKGIFEARFLYSATISDSSAHNLVRYGSKRVQDSLSLVQGKTVFSMELDKKDTVVIYGSGRLGFRHYHHLKGKCNLFLCDRNHETLNKNQEIQVISPEELLSKHKNSNIVITASTYTEKIFHFLKENGFATKQLYLGSESDNENQYFDESLVYGEEEVFVDCGCFDGNNSIEFTKRCKSYKKIIVFEPDGKNIEKIKENFAKHGISSADFYQNAVWNKEEVLYFQSDADDLCSVKSSGTLAVQGNTIDNATQGKRVTFIKMDIEGSELFALEGAKETISTHKPKLAISIYHKPEDILELPLYIKSLVPEYQFFLRHYTGCTDDTILYAVVKSQ